MLCSFVAAALPHGRPGGGDRPLPRPQRGEALPRPERQSCRAKGLAAHARSTERLRPRSYHGQPRTGTVWQTTELKFSPEGWEGKALILLFCEHADDHTNYVLVRQVCLILFYFIFLFCGHEDDRV